MSDTDYGHAEKEVTVLARPVVVSGKRNPGPSFKQNRPLCLKDSRVRTAYFWQEMHEPFNPRVVVVKVTQDAAMGYNENVVFASWHMFAHAERGFRRCHSIHVQVMAQFPKGTWAVQ